MGEGPRLCRGRKLASAGGRSMKPMMGPGDKGGGDDIRRWEKATGPSGDEAEWRGPRDGDGSEGRATWWREEEATRLGHGVRAVKGRVVGRVAMGARRRGRQCKPGDRVARGGGDDARCGEEVTGPGAG